MRPSKTDYYLDIAAQVAKRSTCLRRQYGAIVVRDDQIIGTGYNGSARGIINCCDRGTCQREAMGVPPGERYELCESVHAEVNACLAAGRERCIGATLYIAGWQGDQRLDSPAPCFMCARVIRNCGIKEVIS